MPLNRCSVLCRLLLLLLLFNLLPSAKGQVCTNWQYGKSYNGMGSGNMQFIFQLTDGNLLMGGIVNGKLMLIKINPDGDTLWNKRYDCISSFGPGLYMKAVQGKDGNIYCFASNSYLLKLDIDGNILASSQVFIVGSYNFRDMDVLANGDLVFLIDHVPNDYLVRVKPDLSTVVWTKYIYNSGFTYSYASTMYLSDITVDGDRIVAAGVSNGKGTILCIDAASGILFMEKDFTINNQNINIHDIYSYNNGYLAHAYTSGSTDNHFTVRLDKSLNIIRTYNFTNIPSQSLLSYAVDPDGSYYLSHGVSVPKLLRVDKNDVLQWSKSNGSIIFANAYQLIKTNQGLMATSGGNYTAVPTGINYWYYCVSKSDLNGDVGNCTSTSFPVTLVPASTQNYNEGITSEHRGDAVIIPANASIIREVVSLSTNCFTLKTCSSLTIAGPAAICGNSPVSFKAVRNSNCSLPIDWKIEGVASDSEILNDSMLSVKFLQSGNYRLIAFLPGACRRIADTLAVQVTIVPTASINLGPDTLLCLNNTIRLDPGPGFATYKWQDNSTGPFFDVMLPGKYYVDVTDACSNTYSDTVMVNAAPVFLFELGPDVTKCNDDTIRIPAPAGFSNYNWSPNYNIINIQAPIAEVFPASTTKYIVSAEKWHGCTVKDSLWVVVNRSPGLYIGKDTTICKGDSIQLTAAPGFAQYKWNTGSTAPIVMVKQAGEYAVNAIDLNNCSSRDTILIMESAPAVHLTRKPTLCTGSERWLDAGPGFQSYLWNTGSTEQQISVSDTGTWYVSVVNQLGCKASDTTRITKLLPSPADFLPADTGICSYSKIELKPSGNYSTYSWNTGENGNKIIISKPGMYTLTVTDAAGCDGKDEILVSLKDCLEGFFVPNAFTPNGDGRNDVFKPALLGIVVSYRFSIYNRWGQRIFETADPQKGWDGLQGGKPQFNNEFVWVCAFQFEGQAARVEKGIVIPVH